MPDLWLFGYGSIMWKTGFPFEESRLAQVNHHARRFWQASTDHRGTPDRPGRVVTLIDAPGEVCRGIAYRLPAVADQVMTDLDHREKGGYERVRISIVFDTGDAVDGITYRAAGSNPFYLGQAPEADIARQIASATGPSGSNIEYILRLHETLVAHNIQDQHVSTIAALVRTITGAVHEHH